MKISIRQATPADSYAILKYTKKILDETPYMISTSKEYLNSIEDEEFWTRQTYEDGGIILLAFSGRSLVGLLSVNRHRRIRKRHTCSFGISVKKSHHGKGIGSLLMNEMISWAEKQPGLEKINLEVFSNNIIARRLYQKLGFREEGRLLKDIKYVDGTYADLINMGMFLKKD
ncbi:GNAT family N-acetyltransferase [Metabacillus sp. RGM 3146]|uniref:GNAT family N-acetyltransferase n=1 Tax=Metabacillus sp. RGM 3146 TaxID=3401092 RepID=UPI003B9B60F4